MLNQSILYLVLSLLLVLLQKYAKLVLVYINLIVSKISTLLSPVLTEIGFGNPLQKILLLALIPVAITAVPAGIYYFFYRKTMPYYFQLTWGVWLVVVLSNLLIR